MPRKILIADDHSAIRKGLIVLLELELRIKGMVGVSSCKAVLNEITNREYSHAVLDVELEDGNITEILPMIRKVRSDLKIIIYSMQPSHIYRGYFARYGIEYVSKSVEERSFLETIGNFLNNGRPRVNKIDKQNGGKKLDGLTAKQLKVVQMLVSGETVGEIAIKLGIAHNSVSGVKQRVFEKLGVSNIPELVTVYRAYREEKADPA